MASTFEGQRISQPVVVTDDPGWDAEIAAADHAVSVLLDLKRQLLRVDPQYEHVLWCRHVDQLRSIKRKLDAVCT